MVWRCGKGRGMKHVGCRVHVAPSVPGGDISGAKLVIYNSLMQF